MISGTGTLAVDHSGLVGLGEGRLRSGHGSVAYHECPVGMGFGKLPWAFCHVALSIPERYLGCVTMSRCFFALHRRRPYINSFSMLFYRNIEHF